MQGKTKKKKWEGQDQLMSFLGGGGWLSKGKHSFNITSLYNSSPAFIFLCMNGAWAKNGGKSKDLNLKCLTQHA